MGTNPAAKERLGIRGKNCERSEREEETFRAEKTDGNNNGNNNNSCCELSAYCTLWALYTPELS